MRLSHLVTFSLAASLAAGGATVLAAQSAATWSAPLRGSWVQTGSVVSGDVTLATGASACDIVVGANEGSNVKQAAAFLAGDIERISGQRPAIIEQPTEGRVAIHLVTLGVGRIPDEVGASAMQGQWEAYRVATAGNDVWLVGSTSRGTAFAVYTLSERLGVDPLYIWTGYIPEHHNPLILKRTRFAQGPPTVRYRGFFHDDEDILPRPFDARGYPSQTGDVSLDWYKRFFETALRLKMNMVAPYTRVHRRMEVQQLASDWGLYYTSHHYDILLSNPFGITTFHLAAERGVKPEYDWFTNHDGVLAYWKGGVMENRNIDAIWPVGMRGTSDRAYTFPPGTTDEQKAQTFHDVIAAQVDMVKQLLPKERAPIFHFTMYTEMLDQYRKNPQAFGLPDDVIIVWPDDNDGYMRGLPTELGRWKHGVYYHLAYLGGNLSKQIVNMVPPQTLATEFQKIVKSGATEFMLVNTSETREYVMGARMIADITWDAPSVYAAPDPAGRFVKWWSREYFGPGSATVARAAYDWYDSLLNVPDKIWYGSEAVEGLVRRLSDRVAGNPPSPVSADTVTQLQARERELAAALAATSKAKQAMTLEQQQYFAENLELGFQVAERQTHAALLLADALKAPTTDRMWALVQRAQAALDQLEIDLLRAEHPPFERWYHETWIRSAFSTNNPHRSYNEVRSFLASQGRAAVLPSPRPTDRRPTSRPPR